MKVTVNSVGLAKTLGIQPGDTVDVPCKDGVPISREWRNRLKDVEIDNCVTVCADKPLKTEKEVK